MQNGFTIRLEKIYASPHSGMMKDLIMTLPVAASEEPCLP